MTRRIVGLGFLGLLGLQVVHAQAPAPGLFAAYAMTDGQDASGNARHATLTNTTTTPGQYGSAQQFTGTNSRMSAPSATFTNAFTLEAWVFLQVSGALTSTRASGPPLPPGRPGVRASVSGWQAIVYQNLDVVYLAEVKGFLSAGFTTTAGTLIQIVGPSRVEENAWHHAAVTYDGAFLTLYGDGVQVARIAATGAIRNSTAPLEIGGSAVDQGYLTGRLDDVRIYTRALSPAEITVDRQTRIDATIEPVTGWDLEVWPKGADPAGASPIATMAFDKVSAACNLAPLPPPVMPVVNPTTARVTDPGTAGRDCELAAAALFNGVPLGTGYFTTARAKGATGTSARSVISNAFDRVAVVVPPPVPGAPVIRTK